MKKGNPKKLFNATALLTAMFLLFTCFLNFTGAKASTVKAASSDVTIDIVSMNDFHGALEESAKKDNNGNVIAMQGADIMAGKYDAIKANNPAGTILVSAGDMSQGTPISNVLYGKPVMEMMNTMGTQLMAIGNHEFDWGIDKLNEMKSEANFPFLSCNIYDKTTGKRASFATPYTIIPNQGVNIAFIGVTTPETAITTMPSITSNLEFRDPATEVNSLISEVKGKGADLIVVVGHIGATQASDGSITGEAANLANKLSSSDVCAIISGHTHTQVAGTVNNIPIVQGYYNGRGLGHVTIVYNTTTKKVESSTPKYEDAYKTYSTITKDTAVANIVAAAKTEVGPKFDVVLGTAAANMINDSNNESAVGDWVTDSMTKAVGAQFGFETAGDLRCDIQKGNVTVGDIYTLLPWDNFVYTMKLTGAQIKNILENGATLKMGMVQVSGLKFKYDSSKPEGSRVFDITDASGKAVDMTKSYTVAVNDYLATGGDNYTDFTKGTDVVDTGLMERDLVIQNLKDLNAAGKQLSVSVDNRIVAAKQGSTDSSTTSATTTTSIVAASTLPKTGSAPTEVYVVFGGLFAALGAYLISKKNNA